MPILFAPGAALGLGLLGVGPLGCISKRNGRVNLNQAVFGNICLDDASQRRYSQAHYRGFLCAESGSRVLSLKTAQEAFLLPFRLGHVRFLFSD